MRRFATACFIVLLVLVLACEPAYAGGRIIPPEPYSQDITKLCKFTPSSNVSLFTKALDSKLSTSWTSKTGQQTITVKIPEATRFSKYDLSGFYIRWNQLTPWELYDSTGKVASASGYYAEWVPVSEKPGAVLTFTAPKFSLLEISAFSGAKPPYAPAWEPPQQADVMVVATHPDDECLFMGGFIPPSIDRGYRTMTIFMSYCTPQRRIEAQEAAWMLGQRMCPVFGTSPDAKTTTIEKAMRKRGWSESIILPFLVEQIRKYKPSIIATHDIRNGEYNNGIHAYVALETAKAFDLAGNSANYQYSADTYGVHAPQKLYVHLDTTEPQLVIDMDQPLDKYRTMSLVDILHEAFNRHKSQVRAWNKYFNARYDARLFGLYRSTVGADSGGNDIFENIQDRGSQDTITELNNKEGEE